MNKLLFFPMRITFFIFLFFVSKAYTLSYEHIWQSYASIHVLIVNPKEHAIVPVRASLERGRETVETLAKRYGATAAVNGGFWKASGDPAGILKIDGVFLGIPNKPRAAVGWSMQNQKVYIDRILTDEDLKIIPMTRPPYTTSQEWEDCEHIVGGTPLLIQEGKVLEDYSLEQTLLSFLTNRHARTAIGIRESGEWVFVTVDAFPLGGLSILELANLLHTLGCIQALNLDGGSSSTLVIEGKVINTPKYLYLEAVSDAILIF